MRFAFEVVKRGSLANHTVLEIVQTDATAWCMPCDTTVSNAGCGHACPQSGGYQLQVTGGDRLRVMDIQVA